MSINYRFRSRGFTLIELLVVIAIIGILSAVVLASLNTARNKGSDAAIKSDLDTIRSQAVIYSDSQPNNVYGTNTATESSCTATDNMFYDPNILRAVASAEKLNTDNVTCTISAGGNDYVVFAQLVTDPTSYWCVDSVSVGKLETAAMIGTTPLASFTTCP